MAFNVVAKAHIAANGEYNLSAERYRNEELRITHYELVELGEVAEVISGQSPEGQFYNEKGDGLPFYQGKTEFGEIFLGEPKKWTTQVTREAYKDDILMSVRAPVGPVNLATQKICIGRGLAAIRPKDRLHYLFLFYFLKSIEDKIVGGGGSVFDSINRSQIEQIKIPLPPLDAQQAIVAEIEGYQRIVDGARQVVAAYTPQIKIDPAWEMVELGEVAEVTSSKRIFQNEYVNRGIPFYRTKEIVELSQGKPISLELFISEKRYNEIKQNFDVPKKDEILVSAVGTIGISWVISDDREFYFKDGNLLWIKGLKGITPYFLKQVLDQIFSLRLNEFIFGAAYNALTIVKLKKIQIPLPDLVTQQRIVAQIEEEQALVDANKTLIALFEQKIRDAIAAVWHG